MTLRFFTLVVIIISALLVFTWLQSGVRAAECASPLDTVIAQIDAAGGSLIDLVDIPGKSADQMVLFEVAGKIIAGLVVNSCMTGAPLVLAESRGTGTPT